MRTLAISGSATGASSALRIGTIVSERQMRDVGRIQVIPASILR